MGSRKAVFDSKDVTKAKKITEGLSTYVINIILLSAISVVEGIQILTVAALASHFIPIPSPLSNIVLPEYVTHISLERELLLYRLFITMILVVQGFSLIVFRHRLNDKDFVSKCTWFLFVEAAFVVAILCLLFKSVVYVDAMFLRYFAWVLLGVSILFKISWIKNDSLSRKASFFLDHRVRLWAIRLLDFLMPLLIVCILFIQDLSGALGVIFTNDRLHHLDAFIAAPAWASVSGLRPSIDTFSEYGVGMPLLLGRWIASLGEFTYQNILLVLTLMVITYFIIYYFFLKMWLGSTVMAAIGLLLALTWNVFSVDASDYFIWKHPSATVVRYFFDGLFFVFLVLHSRDASRKIFLILALFCSGAALFYVTDSGIYLVIAAYSYLMMGILFSVYRKEMIRAPRDRIFIGISFVLPWAIAFVLFWIALGTHVFSGILWTNLREYIELSLGGFEALPVYWGLQEKYFSSFFFGMVMIITYLMTLVTMGSLGLLRKIEKKHTLLIPMSVYGLCIYHYFIFRSSPLGFHVIVIPFVSILCYAIYWLLENVNPAVRKKILIGLFVFAAFFLLTSPAFLRYPHLFHGRGDFLSDKKELFLKELALEEDVKLIQTLSSPHGRVPLISSFETAMLMKAKRRPFFYYFPLLNSRYLWMKDFSGMRMYTTKQLTRFMNQLNDEKPKYIFIEKKLFLGELPLIYYVKFSSLREIVQYLRHHYEPAEKGNYLVAIKRKDISE